MSENELSLLYKAGLMLFGYSGALVACASMTDYLDKTAEKITKPIIKKFNTEPRDYQSLDEKIS